MTLQSSESRRLPLQLTSLVGREDEIARARDLLDSTRLLTLTGPGGSGKTRLALATAGKVRDGYPDGVFFVSLAAVTDPAFVVPAIATEMGIRPAADRSGIDGLADALGDRVMLLVLDNFEQIVDAAPGVTSLLSDCAGLKVIVTSRIALHVGGEQILPVLPLALPQTGRASTLPEIVDNPAVKLFAERASAVDPTFRVTDDNVAAVVEICRRVDGLPLAIELAAARLGMFSAGTLAERLQHRLPLLTGGARDAPIRQQTIRDTIAWSYDLLAPDEQWLFRRASIFSGGWSYEAIEALASGYSVDVLDTLTALIDHSLVNQLRQPDGSTRYGMLETIREYGLDRLDEAQELPDAALRHAAYILEFVERADRASITSKQLTWARRLLADVDNIRAALRWTIENDPVQALRISSALRILWLTSGFLREGGDWIESALAGAPNAPVAIRASALSSAGELACWQGDFGPSREMLEAARDLFAEIDAVEDYNYSLFTLARLAHFQGDFESADALYQQCTRFHRQIGNWYAVAGAIGNRGMMAMGQGDVEQAATLIEEALQLCREHEFVIQVPIWARPLGQLALMRGDQSRARELMTEAIRIDADISKARIPEDLEAFAELASFGRGPDRAAMLYGAAHRLRLTTGFPISFYQRASHERNIVSVRAALSEAVFDAQWQQGEAMSADEAVALVLEAFSDTTGMADEPGDQAGPRLTPRETEVLRMIVDGASDREIAVALFISPYTAMRHVANILNKLDVSSRTAAATWAVRNGLV